MGEVVLKKHYTIEEYLELQSQVDYKIAYHYGEIYDMAGVSIIVYYQVGQERCYLML